MQSLKGKHIYLRALEPEDLEFLYKLENDMSIWEISGTQKPYSKATLKNYLSNAHLDIFEIKQLRLCICDLQSDVVMGFIDLFDFDPKNQRAGIGLVIQSPSDRGKGYGKEALQLLCSYAFTQLNLHQLYANILSDNEASIHLFESMGFERVGVKEHWIFFQGKFKDELLYQKINREQP